CRERYAEFVRNSFDPNRAILDQAPIEEEQGAEGDIGHNFDDDLGLDLPDDLEPWHDFSKEELAEYEPSEPEVENEVLPGHDGDRGSFPAPGELDFMEVEREPLEALPEGERDALMSSVMYLESVSFAGAATQAVERVEGKENPLVRCRVVARDFAQGATAAQLGISAATSSAEALRTFLFYAGSKRQNIVGLDVSTAFLFADLDEEGEVVVKLPDGVV
ncbi:unnamed protein product, partial [Symbiodinium sp. CCMP2456]